MPRQTCRYFASIARQLAAIAAGLAAAAAIEILHNFSLVHDDIEMPALPAAAARPWQIWGIEQAINTGMASPPGPPGDEPVRLRRSGTDCGAGAAPF
ncbi:MAG: polyprenyl synthetase family protein [Ardenticatenaceae bacterium]|nr:polyprenyl synthetase family protein [Ardenticatenaceae bacterium]